MKTESDRHQPDDDAVWLSNELFCVLAESASDAILTISEKGIIQYANTAAERIFGYTIATMVGESLTMLIPDRLRTAHRVGLSRYLETNQRQIAWSNVELPGLHKSGKEIPLEISYGEFATGGKRFFTGIIRDTSAQKQTQEELQCAREELEQRVARRTHELAAANALLKNEIAERKRSEEMRTLLLQRLVTAQEEERQHLSREMHDQLGQYLAALMLGLRSVQNSIEPSSPAQGGIIAVQKLITQLSQEVRRLAVELRPSALDDLGLHTALANHLEEWSDRYGINTDFHSNGLIDKRLPPNIETTIYRVVQETLNNVVKHAQAERVSIILEHRSGRVIVVLEDDGIGFDVEAAWGAPIGERRLGLIGMRERVESAGGALEIESTPGVGTTIVARIPTSPHGEKKLIHEQAANPYR